MATHKILRILAQTRLDGKEVPFDSNPLELIRKSEKENNLHCFKKEEIYFCSYKTVYEGEPAIILIFTMNLPGPTTGSSASSTIVMDIVALMEKYFSPLDDTEFTRDVEGSKKNIAILKIIKKVREDDLV